MVIGHFKATVRQILDTPFVHVVIIRTGDRTDGFAIDEKGGRQLTLFELRHSIGILVVCAVVEGQGDARRFIVIIRCDVNLYSLIFIDDRTILVVF